MMDKLKKYFQTRAIGFYVTAVTAIAVFIAIILYPVLFFNVFWDVGVLLWLIFAFILAIALIIGGIFIKGLENWAPAVLGAGAFLAFLFFVLISYDIFVRVLGEYEDVSFPTGYIFMLVFFGLIITASIVGIFMRQSKKMQIA